MYESPIEVLVSEMQMKQTEEREKQIYECIQQYGINVDKEELIKALQYDRDQYEKGYKDAIIKFAEEAEERLLELRKTYRDYKERCVVNACRLEIMEMVGDINV